MNSFEEIRIILKEKRGDWSEVKKEVTDEILVWTGGKMTNGGGYNCE